MKRTIYITHQGARLHRTDGTIVVSADRATLDRWPPDEVDRVVIFGNVQVTTQAMALLLAHDATIALMSSTGELRGNLVGRTTGSVFVRLAQHARYHDVPFRLAFARDLVCTKLIDAREVLQRHRRNHQSTTMDTLDPAAEQLRLSVQSAQDAPSDAVLRGVEGAGAAAYFGVFDTLIRAPFSFGYRSRRPAHNAVNALLNLGYTLVGNELSSRLEAAGFDPRVGFYHGVQYGRSSLALDLLEAHRIRVVDRFTLSLINRRMLTPEDFVSSEEHGVRLTRDALRRYLSAYEAMMARPTTQDASHRVRIEAQITALRAQVMPDAPSGAEEVAS